MKLLSAPPNLNGGGSASAVGSSICQNVTTVQGISVCEDRIDFQDCMIISSISSNMCDHFGSLQFEKYWSQRGCKVTVFHLFIYIKGNVCNTPGNLPLLFFLPIIIVFVGWWPCWTSFQKLAHTPVRLSYVFVLWDVCGCTVCMGSNPMYILCMYE